MARITTARNRTQATIAIVGCVFLFTAFGLMVYGRFCTSVGMAGLYNRASLGVAFILFGISLALFTPCVFMQRMYRKRIVGGQLAREFAGLALGFCCYVVPFFLAMGALSATDRIGVMGLVLMVAFGAIPFLYRRYRKKHPIRYEHTGSAALVLFCGALGLVSLVGGSYACSEMLDDLNGGWKQDTFAFYEVSIDRPSGRSAWLTPTTYEVDLYRNGAAAQARHATAHLSVNESDWPAVALVLEEPLAEVRWYPQTRTLVGARDVDSALAAGDAID